MENKPTTNPMKSVLTLKDFRFLFFGSSTSLLGDQFALIATPWLTLQLTNDPLALGIVLALEGIPRAIFMLLGGAVTDRISPRRVMLIADWTRFILTGLMALAVFTGAIQTWMLYVFSLAFGLVAGFAVPAENSIVPLIVKNEDLQAGNSIMMGIGQLIGFVGPTVAGIVIARFGQSFTGITLAYTIDAVSFVVSACCLILMHSGSQQDKSTENLVLAIKDGLKFMWQDKSFRFLMIVLTVMNFILIGPLLVGIPVLADKYLPEGATAYGLLMSGFAGGNLVGYVLAGSLPRPGTAFVKAVILGLFGCFALVLASLGIYPNTWLDFALMLMLGLGNGYIGILMFTWIQLHTPKQMIGRMMSIIMFFNSGLLPVSQALSGAFIKISLQYTFIIAGGLALLATLWVAIQPELTHFCKTLGGPKTTIETTI